MVFMYILHTREETKDSVHGPLLNNIFSTALIVTSLVVNLLSYVHLKRLANPTSRNNNASIELEHVSSTSRQRNGISQGESDERKREAVKLGSLSRYFASSVICH